MHQSPRADSVEDPAASARSLTSRATRWRGHGFPWLHGNVAEGVNETTSPKEKPFSLSRCLLVVLLGWHPSLSVCLSLSLSRSGQRWPSRAEPPRTGTRKAPRRLT